MDRRDGLLEKLRKIEALCAGAATDGERVAADNARQRIAAKLKRYEHADPPVEHRFTLENRWSRKLFVALLRRYGLRPCRFRRQRLNTVMVRVSRSFVTDTLWPEFVELDHALREHLDRVTDEVIAQGISRDTSEADEVGTGTGHGES